MNKKTPLLLLTALLLAEAILIVLLPARIPRAARAVTAGTNVIAAAVIWLMARQRSSDK